MGKYDMYNWLKNFPLIDNWCTFWEKSFHKGTKECGGKEMWSDFLLFTTYIKKSANTE